LALFCPQEVCELNYFGAEPASDSLVAWFCLQDVCELTHFGGKPTADSLVALFCSQRVRELVILVENQLLTLLWPCSALSEYVNWSF
jgi:hypothetical protein